MNYPKFRKREIPTNVKFEQSNTLDLARYIGHSSQTIYNWETNKPALYNLVIKGWEQLCKEKQQ